MSTPAERQKKYRSKVAKQLHKANKLLNDQAKLSEAYEEIAKAHGFKDWNTAAKLLVKFNYDILNALLEQKEEQYVQKRK